MDGFHVAVVEPVPIPVPDGVGGFTNKSFADFANQYSLNARNALFAEVQGEELGGLDTASYLAPVFEELGWEAAK